MGTVNGLECGDFGPVGNTQRLMLPAGRRREKDSGAEKSEGLPVLKQSKLGLMKARVDTVSTEGAPL